MHVWECTCTRTVFYMWMYCTWEILKGVKHWSGDCSPTKCPSWEIIVWSLHTIIWSNNYNVQYISIHVACTCTCTCINAKICIVVSCTVHVSMEVTVWLKQCALYMYMYMILSFLTQPCTTEHCTPWGTSSSWCTVYNTQRTRERVILVNEHTVCLWDGSSNTMTGGWGDRATITRNITVNM